MHKREVGDIKKILDSTRATGLHDIRATVYHAKIWLVPLRKFRYIVRGRTRANPDPVIFFLHMINRRARSHGRLLVRMRGKAHTAPFLVIGPAMIGTNEGIVLDFAQRELRPPMHAEIAPGMCVSIDTPEHNILVEQTRRYWFTFEQIRRISHDMPIIEQNRIIYHLMEYPFR